MRVLLVLLCLLLTGCVRFNWERELRFEPPPPGTIETLRTGQTDLQQTLDKFGAPLSVWEYPSPNGEGAVLAYGWYEFQDKGFRISTPEVFGRGTSPSFSYARLDSRTRGLVLFYDKDWKLVSWRTGLLQDITAGLGKRRPAYIEDEASRETESECQDDAQTRYSKGYFGRSACG